MTRPLDHRILLQCGRARLEPSEAANLRTLISDVTDWTPLTALADGHGMLPLLAHHVQAVTADVTGLESIRASLRGAFLKNAAQSLMLVAELRGALDDLGAAGIRVLPYKGPMIALAAYGSLALRRMRDLDLIVAPDDVSRAQAILLRRGYRQHSRMLPAPLGLRLEYQSLMIRESDSALVELHWMVAPPNVVSGPLFEELWARRVMQRFQGVDTQRMSPADIVLTLCIHGTKHRWSRLEWIVTVAELVRSSFADWRVVADLAAGVGAARMVRMGMHLARVLLDVPLPAELSAWVDADPRATQLGDVAAAHLFTDPKVLTELARELGSFQWRSQDGLAGRLRYLYYWPLVRLGRRTVG